jgi:hypothetical protein
MGKTVNKLTRTKFIIIANAYMESHKILKGEKGYIMGSWLNKWINFYIMFLIYMYIILLFCFLFIYL